MASREAIARTLKMLSAAYANASFDEMAAEVWHQYLTELDDGGLAEAVARAMRDNPTFAPSVVAVYNAAVEAGELSAYEAWREVIKACKNKALPDGGWSNQRIKKVVYHLGGLRNICESQRPDYMRGEFMRAWEGITEDEEKQEAPKLLPAVKRLTTQLTGKERKKLDG